MNEALAAAKADQYLMALITHQPNFWPTGGMSNAVNAHAISKNLAAMRKQLIEELKQHPE